MTAFRHWMVATAAIPFLASCSAISGPQDEATHKPVAISFTGKVDPKLVGSWKSANGASSLELGKDGALTMKMSIPGHPGAPSSKKGQWLVDGDRLLLKYANADGSEQTIGYGLKASSDSMTLSTKVPKRDTIYTRPKASI